MPYAQTLAALMQADPDDPHDLHTAVGILRDVLAHGLLCVDEDARDALLDTADELQAAAPADRHALMQLLLAQLRQQADAVN